MSLDFLKDDGVFLPMLNDSGRNKFYKQALEQSAAGKVVCDIGAGTGFLSLLAIQSGADKVIAVERDVTRAEYLSNILKQTGHSDRVEVVVDDFLNTDIQADVYVSETLNTQIFGEDILRLSNHAVKHNGVFIPSEIKIWAEAYEMHPVFILDLAESEAYEFNPEVAIDSTYKELINNDFSKQYDLSNTVFKANRLNRLFTMLGRFNDLKLKQLGQTQPITVNLNQYNDEHNISISIPNQNGYLNNAMIVLKWQVCFRDAILSSDECWFGNMAKEIRPQFVKQPNIVFSYDPIIRDWRLSY